MSGYEAIYYCPHCKEETNHWLTDFGRTASCIKCGTLCSKNNLLTEERIASAVKDINAKIRGGMFLDSKDLCHLVYECMSANFLKGLNIYDIRKIIEEAME